MSPVWKPIPGWEGSYEVSDHGDVRSLDRIVFQSGRPKKLSGRVLKQGRTRPAGYKTDKWVVTLSRHGKMKTFLVHRLVLLAFVGPPAPGQEALHWDDDSSNNHLSNLSWGTRSQNLHDAVRNGRHWNANKTHCKHGHEFTPVNTALTSRGRSCRACRVRQSRIQRARKKAA